MKPDAEKPLLTLRNICRSFAVYGEKGPCRVTALDSVSFTVEKNTCTVIGGANGSGKSVLMTIIAGLESPESGTVAFTGKRVGLVLQNADAQILGETPREDVSIGPRNLRLSKEETARQVERCLEQSGLAQKADSPARFLSGGEKRRLSVAGILAMDADLVIFDEPYANLDWQGVLQVNGIISDLRKNGHTVIVLTHELEKILAAADRFLVLYRGRLVFDGTAQEGLEQPIENWGIRNPLRNYSSLSDLIWSKP